VWLDSHAHVSAPEFDDDREAVLERASAAGIETVVAIGSGWGIEANQAAVELAARDARVFATVGVHPHDAERLDDRGRAQLRLWLERPRVVGVGECGLDYHYMHSAREVQREVFAEQVALARELGRPLSIHVRGNGPDAWEETLEIWNSEGRGDVEGVLHCFTGGLEFARRALEQRLWISFSGILTFRKDRGLRTVAAALPLDRLLVETDSPLLAPEGFRGRRNEPARVTLVGEVLAGLHDVPVEEVARATTANARQVFGLDSGAPKVS
jgi:TatD DNase family protein